MSNDKWVTPGTLLGTEEEYVAGKGTYTEGSKIFSAVLGILEDEDRTLSVKQNGDVQKPHAGAIVIGRIAMIMDPIAIVSIQQIESTDGSRIPVTGDNFVLKVQNIKQGYVKSIKDEYRIGDIIRAKVSEIKNGEVHLTTDGPELGCILAFNANPKARYPLVKTNSSLICEQTDTKQSRKTAADYLPSK